MSLLNYFQARLAADLHTLSAMAARSYKSYHASLHAHIRPAMQAEASTHYRLPLPIADAEAALELFRLHSRKVTLFDLF